MSEQNKTTTNQPQEELITSLIEGQNTSAYIQEIRKEISENDHSSTSRIVTAKYKIYVIFLLILGTILGLNTLPAAQKKYTISQGIVAEKKAEIVKLDNQINKYENTQKFLFAINKYAPAVISCINEEKNCSDLPEDIMKQIEIAKSYLQLGTLKSDKMIIDEKKILRNLDQYLIKEDPSEGTSSRNGMILGIEIGDPQASEINSKLQELPLSVTIEFDTKDNLVSFVKNIEQNIITVAEDRIWYTIKEINYDMMTYDQQQESTIELIAYYFN